MKITTFKQSVAAYKRKDYKAAFSGFKRLAEQGDARAQYNLGLMYDRGTGVPKDEKHAEAWVRTAAHQGHAPAQHNLGLMYAKATGVPKAKQQAVAWVRRAADQGYAPAQLTLSFMYARGTGVRKNRESAYLWWFLCCAQGDADAEKKRDIAEKWVTPQQRAHAEAAARSWKPQIECTTNPLKDYLTPVIPPSA